MTPKTNDLQDRIEYLENALTASDQKIERKLTFLLIRKLRKRFLNMKKKNII